jgi:hypothetical protein
MQNDANCINNLFLIIKDVGMTLKNLFSLVAMTAVLAACGGGGDAAPAPAQLPAGAADKFVGSWGSCAPVTGAVNGVLSARTLFVYTKTGATTLNLSVDGQGFKSAGCAGTAFNTITAIGTANVTLNGTKLIGTQTVDRLDYVAKSTSITAFNGNLKDVALVSGTTLTFGGTSVPDANGYPTALDTLGVQTKQ